jgi:hypothetical protein
MGASTSKALDAVAWLILLLLFEAENQLVSYLRTARYAGLVLRVVRLAAGAGVIAATVGYVFENDVLDALNSAVWIAIVVLLEVEIRYRVRQARALFAAIAAALYGTLALLVVMWALRHQWFDAYDALLWLVAFATLELDVLSQTKRVELRLR